MADHQTLGPRRICTATLALLIAIVASIGSFAQTSSPTREAARLEQASNELQRQEAVFIENRGQWDPRARFLLRSPGLDMWITDNGPVYDLYTVTGADNALDHDSKRSEAIPAASPKGHRSADLSPQRGQRKGHVVRMTFEGNSSAVALQGTDRRRGVHNYFIGNDRAKWAANVPLYSGARASQLYPGIDAIYYLDGGRPRYDLVVAPGADPAAVRMRFDGADRVSVTSKGSLAIATSVGTIEQRELYAYQRVDGKKKQVQCSFAVDAGGMVSFRAGAYDRTRALVIDPLVYSTLIGGTGNDMPSDIAVDGSGNAYITGVTIDAGSSSNNFPTSTGAYQTAYGGNSDLFITKLNSSGTGILYSTYLGGTGHDYGAGIAVDGNGNAYVAGYTIAPGSGSHTFPTTSGAIQTTPRGPEDAFVVKLGSDGTTLTYSTLLGGLGGDYAFDIAVNANGNAYITGSSYIGGSYNAEDNFPVTSGAYQTVHGGYIDAFVAKLNTAGTSLEYSTLLGGTRTDEGTAIAIDGNGNAYATGNTTVASSGANYPTTTGAYQTTHGGFTDIFVTKLNSTGSSLTYSTFIGGTNADAANDIAIDGSGNAHVAGYTDDLRTGTNNFPTTSGAYQSTNRAGRNGIVVKLNSSGTAPVYSTLLGDMAGFLPFAIAIDGSDNACLTGSTGNSSPVTSCAFQTTNRGSTDAFITQLNSSGTSLVYSTLLGGAGTDDANGIAIDGNGDLYITGRGTGGVSGSSFVGFPVTAGAYQTTSGGNFDVFVTKFSLSGTVTVTFPNGGEMFCQGGGQFIRWTARELTHVKIEVSSDGGSNWSTLTSSISACASFYNWIVPLSQPVGTDYRIRISDAANPAISDISNTSFSVGANTAIVSQPASAVTCQGSAVTFSVAASGTNLRYQWNRNSQNISGATSASYTINSVSSNDAGSYNVIVRGACGSVLGSEFATLTVKAPPTITSQPLGATRCLGQSVTFSVTASGTNPGYQWRKDGNPITGANSASYQISSVSAGDAGDYSVVVSGDCGVVTSSTATLTVNGAPIVTTHPATNELVCPGTSVTFSADGSSYSSVRWQQSSDNGSTFTDIAGETATSLTVSAPTSVMHGNLYRAVFSNSCGNTPSAAAMLQVGDNEAPGITLATGVELWPADRSYTTFNVSSIVTGVSDNCTSGMTGNDAVIWKVTSDEAEDGPGNTLNDIVIASDCQSVELRAERDGNGNGRVYRVYVMVTDGNGNASSSSTYYTVSVPLRPTLSAVDDDVVNYEQTCGGGAKPATGRTASGYLLMQNHPNPFSGTTRIEYIVPTASHVSLMVYDAHGRVVATIVDAERTAGMHTAGFDGSQLASGTYSYVLRSNGTVLARTMVLVR